MEPFSVYLPEPIVHLLRSRMTTEFATVSQRGLPINTPAYLFPAADLTTLDLGTGLAYPAKAERVRNNPKVGMLIEGDADDGVVSIAGYAAVKDADLQGNLERYLAETILSPGIDPAKIPWEVTRRNKTYYLPRLIICVAPYRIRWWPNRAAMDHAPDEWRAPANTCFPVSDPAPLGRISRAPQWPSTDWHELADRLNDQDIPGHLTLLDEEGFPLPIRIRSYERHPNGFCITLPTYTPWANGKATLSFFGREVFAGEVTRTDNTALFVVERALPILPMMENPGENPDKSAFDRLIFRLEREAQRRNQSVPIIPRFPPAPTEGAKLRAAAAQGMDLSVIGSGIARN